MAVSQTLKVECIPVNHRVQNAGAQLLTRRLPVAIGVLKALDHYAKTGQGRVKPLSGEFEGLMRLRVGNHRVVFEETADEVIVHRIRDRKNAYQ